jgi:hypothetical protein
MDNEPKKVKKLWYEGQEDGTVDLFVHLEDDKTWRFKNVEPVAIHHGPIEGTDEVTVEEFDLQYEPLTEESKAINRWHQEVVQGAKGKTMLRLNECKTVEDRLRYLKQEFGEGTSYYRQFVQDIADEALELLQSRGDGASKVCGVPVRVQFYVPAEMGDDPQEVIGIINRGLQRLLSEMSEEDPDLNKVSAILLVNTPRKGGGLR